VEEREDEDTVIQSTVRILSASNRVRVANLELVAFHLLPNTETHSPFSSRFTKNARDPVSGQAHYYPFRSHTHLHLGVCETQHTRSSPFRNNVPRETEDEILMCTVAPVPRYRS
jgi:hypothetical protein